MESNDRPRKKLWDDRIGEYFEAKDSRPRRTFIGVKGGRCVWYLWHESDAVKILNEGEFISFLSENPEGSYSIRFDDGAVAQINQGDPLWQLMVRLDQEYQVEVFLPYEDNGKHEYIPWTDTEGHRERFFVEIRISQKGRVAFKYSECFRNVAKASSYEES